MNPLDDACPAPSLRELRWWDPRRETAYEALLRGDKPGDVAVRLTLQARTLLRWRRHPYWAQRYHREQAERREAYARQLSAVDEAALRALPDHVAKSASVGLRYVHLRGLLAAGPKGDSSPGCEIDLDNPRDVLPSLFSNQKPSAADPPIAEPPLPPDAPPAYTGPIGTEAPIPFPPSEPPLLPAHDPHTPQPGHLPPWKRKLLEHATEA